MHLRARAIVVVILALYALPALALRCGGDLVQVDDPAFAVRRACGDPDWVGAYSWGYGVDEQIWHYNFGPNELIRILHFRAGQLRRIATGGHGFVERDRAGSCRPTDVQQGMTAHELLQRCGRPVQRDVGRVEYRSDRPTRPGRPRHRQFHPVFVEHWYYDFGSGYLPRRLRLVNGIVAEIHTSP